MYEILMYDEGNFFGCEKTCLDDAKIELEKYLQIALSDYIKALEDIVYDKPIKKIKSTWFDFATVSKVSEYHFKVVFTGNKRGEISQKDILIRKISINELL